MKIKFSPGDNVAYKPRTSPSIEMRDTKIVGFDSVREFAWKKQHCDITKERRHKRTASGPMENRYVIEHFFGWRPAVQSGAGINPDLKLDRDRRYFFAYESELTLNRDK